MTADAKPDSRWYEGLTRYQWVVLLIASLGWIFDVFEGQIFVVSMNEAMKSLLPDGTPPGRVAFYNDVTFCAFLVGGALGGIAFGMLSDRIGRTRRQGSRRHPPRRPRRCGPCGAWLRVRHRNWPCPQGRHLSRQGSLPGR